MVRIGLVGIGFMGMIHFLAARRLEGAGAVVALCSRDAAKRAGDWRGIQGNFGPRGEQMDLGGVRTYATLPELLADPDVDLVDLCLPTPQHTEAVRQCLLAGKHVLVEKPLTLDVTTAAELVALAKQQGRQLLVAHVLPFFSEFRFLYDYFRGGMGGQLLALHLERVISRPDWSDTIADAASTGGPIVDLHIHDTHFLQLLFGLPRAVSSRGVVGASGAVEHVATQYDFGENGPASVTSVCGAICMKGRPFTHGYAAYFEKATLLFQAGTQPLTLLTPNGERQQLQLPGGDDPVEAFAEELTTAVASVATGDPSPILSGGGARDALLLCRKEEEAVRGGGWVRVK